MALQYKHSEFSNTLATALSNGTCAECMLDKNAAILMAIDAVKRYQVFDANTQDVVKVTATRNLPGSVTILLEENSTSIVKYSGDGTGSDVVETFKSAVDSGTNYHTLIDGNCLYIYTLEGESSMGTITAPVIQIGDDVLVTTEVDNTYISIEDLIDINSFNCLTEEQLCNIISYAKKFLNKIT